MARQRLHNRRSCEIWEFEHAGHTYSLSVGRFHDGRVSEIFLSPRLIGSPLEAIARDAAIVTSIALQHGADIEIIRKALTKGHGGQPATYLGAALNAMD
jgi:hypothetical protein